MDCGDKCHERLNLNSLLMLIEIKLSSNPISRFAFILNLRYVVSKTEENPLLI